MNSSNMGMMHVELMQLQTIKGCILRPGNACLITCCNCTATLPTFVGASLENWEAGIALEQLGHESTTVTVTGEALALQTPCAQEKRKRHFKSGKGCRE